MLHGRLGDVMGKERRIRVPGKRCCPKFLKQLVTETVFNSKQERKGAFQH